MGFHDTAGLLDNLLIFEGVSAKFARLCIIGGTFPSTSPAACLSTPLHSESSLLLLTSLPTSSTVNSCVVAGDLAAIASDSTIRLTSYCEIPLYGSSENGHGDSNVDNRDGRTEPSDDASGPQIGAKGEPASANIAVSFEGTVSQI